MSATLAAPAICACEEPKTRRFPVVPLLLGTIALGYIGIFLLLPLVMVFAGGLSKGLAFYWHSIQEADAVSAMTLTLTAAAISVPLGMLVGNVRFVQAVVEPLMGFIRYMPVPAFIPLIVLYVGIGETAKMLVIFVGVVVQMVIMVADVTKQTPADLMRAAMALGARPSEVFTKVVWRQSLPGLFDVLRLNLGWAWTYLVVAELVAANTGLGYRILKAQRFLQTDVIFLYIGIIGLLGVTSDLMFQIARKKLFPWAEENLRS